MVMVLVSVVNSKLHRVMDERFCVMCFVVDVANFYGVFKVVPTRAVLRLSNSIIMVMLTSAARYTFHEAVVRRTSRLMAGATTPQT